MSLIELKDLTKIYGFGDATTLALDEVNLTVKQGEFIAVMGPSGSGKSTLMNIIGLLDRPSHGIYNLNGKSVDRLRSNRRAKIRRDTVGFVFQSYNLLPRLTVLENVALPLTYKGVTQTRRLKRAGTMLEQVGLSDKEYFYPKHLSGGQIQRVAIARALISNPKIIIADEPTGNLDSHSSLVVMELLSQIHRDGATVLMVTHNPELTRYASRVVFMHDGSIVADEKSQIGQIAPIVKRKLYSAAGMSEEDQLMAVSALMSIEKDLTSKNKTSSKRKSPVKKRKYTRKSKKGAQK